MMSKRLGYILMETLVAMAVLSLGMFTIQGSMRQILAVRGQTRDYTQALFLLQQMVDEVSLQQVFREDAPENGRFEGEFSRFEWRWTVSKVTVPAPPMPPAAPVGLDAATLEQRRQIYRPPQSFLGKIAVTVSWTRGGQRFEETVETLIAPERLITEQEDESKAPKKP